MSSKSTLNHNSHLQKTTFEGMTAVAEHIPQQKLAHSIDEFCSLTGLGRSFIYEEIRAGRLKAIKKGRRRLILDEDGRAYLRS